VNDGNRRVKRVKSRMPLRAAGEKVKNVSRTRDKFRGIAKKGRNTVLGRGLAKKTLGKHLAHRFQSLGPPTTCVIELKRNRWFKAKPDWRTYPAQLECTGEGVRGPRSRCFETLKEGESEAEGNPVAESANGSQGMFDVGDLKCSGRRGRNEKVKKGRN